jgi:hypothetical protein
MKLTQRDIEYVMNEARAIVAETINEAKKGKGGKKKSDKKKSGDSFNGEGQDINVHALQNKGLNLAQYAYRLYPNMDKASARSKFYKKVKHEKVTDGYSKKKTYKYSLSPEEAGIVSNLVTKPLKVKK